MLLKQCKREQGIHFVVTMEVSNKKLLAALEESEDISNGKVKAERYKNFNVMLKDLD